MSIKKEKTIDETGECAGAPVVIIIKPEAFSRVGVIKKMKFHIYFYSEFLKFRVRRVR